MVTATLELNNTVPDLRRMFQALWFNQSVTLSGTDSGNVVTVTRLWPGYQVVVKSFAGPIAPTVGEALDTAVTVRQP